MFITLDRTDDFSSRQATYLASALGIRESLPGAGSRVGELFIINARTKELVSTISLRPSSDTMAAMIEDALASLR